MKNTSDRVLRILAGCPSGATEYALIKLHKVPPATINDLVRRGFVWKREYVNNTIRGRSFAVVWLYLSPEGRAAFNESETRNNQK